MSNYWILQSGSEKDGREREKPERESEKPERERERG